MPPSQRIYLGTSNPEPDKGDGPGIFITELTDGTLTEPRMVAEGQSPSFLALSKDRQTLYTVLGGDFSSAVVAAYTVLEDGSLNKTSEADCGSPGGCHLSLSPDGRTLLSSNYTGATFASFHIADDGSLSVASVIDVVAQEEKSHWRQDAPHPHCAHVSVDGNYVLASDLGLDSVLVYEFCPDTGELSPHKPEGWTAAPGAGPRHTLLHPNGKWVYSINELNSTIDQLAWNSANGTFTHMQTVTSVPANSNRVDLQACEMIFSADLRYLYASNRVHQSFAVFSVDATTGGLTMAQEIENPGRESRHIAIDPTGNYFLSANQYSGDVSVFPLDAASGRLSPRVASVLLPGASCILFA